MKRKGAFWGGPGPGKVQVTTEQLIKETADSFEEACSQNSEAAFAFAWAVAQELEKRFRGSPEEKALKGKEKERSQKALAEFALGSLLKEHERLHRAAVQYAEKLGMVWP